MVEPERKRDEFLEELHANRSDGSVGEGGRSELAEISDHGLEEHEDKSNGAQHHDEPVGRDPFEQNDLRLFPRKSPVQVNRQPGDFPDDRVRPGFHSFIDERLDEIDGNDHEEG